MATSYLKMGVEATQVYLKTDRNIEDNVSGRITITIVAMGDYFTAAVPPALFIILDMWSSAAEVRRIRRWTRNSIQQHLLLSAKWELYAYIQYRTEMRCVGNSVSLLPSGNWHVHIGYGKKY
jgi:hypothetical protein